MKKIHYLILIGLTLLLSCNVHFEKRHYRKGYYVDVVHKNHKRSLNTVEVNNSKNLPSSTPSLSDNSILVDPEIISSTKEIKETFNKGDFQRDEIAIVQKEKAIKSSHKSDLISRKTLGPSTLIANKLQSVKEQKNESSGDILLYLTAALIALGSIAVMKLRPKRIMKITRWAKANPTKNKWLIAALQVPMVTLTVMSGYNLRQLGYELSDTLFYVSSAIVLLGLLSAPRRTKNSPIEIPGIVNRRRMIYLATILASAMMAVSAGNNVEEKFPNSPAAIIINAIDHSIFHDSNEEHSTTTEPSTKSCKCARSRKVAGVAAAISCGMVAFYTFLLICFGIGGSIAMIVVGAIIVSWAIVLIILGAGLLAFVIWALYALFKEPCRKREKKEKVKKVT